VRRKEKKLQARVLGFRKIRDGTKSVSTGRVKRENMEISSGGRGHGGSKRGVARAAEKHWAEFKKKRNPNRNPVGEKHTQTLLVEMPIITMEKQQELWASNSKNGEGQEI